MEQEYQNGSKSAKNGDLGLQNRESHEHLCLLNIREDFGVNGASPLTLFYVSHAEVLAQAS